MDTPKTILPICLLLSFTLAPAVNGQTRRNKPSSRKPRTERTRPNGRSSTVSANQLATTTASGLTYIITRHGDGRQPKSGEIVIAHYTGLLSTGVKFDSSRDRKEPFSFKLGAGQVIKGWDEACLHLRVGDQATLIMPPQLAYGVKGTGRGLIPPGATLVFIVEMIDVKEKALSDVLGQTLSEKGVDAAVEQYHELKIQNIDNIYQSEGDLNALGYRLLKKKRAREAIEIFKLNVEAYPQSSNAYDSLAEAYMTNGDREFAIQNFERSLDLNPGNKQGIRTPLRC